MENNFFQKEKLNSYTSWLLGFIYADGNVFNNRITLALKASDKAVLSNFKKRSKEKNNQVRYVKQTNSYSFSFSDSNTVSDLKFYNIIPNKTFLTRFNNILEIFQDSPELLRHFIRGYYEGNGCLTKDLLELNVCGNIQLIDELSAYLSQTLNITIKHKSHQNGKSKYLRIFSDKDKLTFLNWMYKSTNKYNRLERKYKKYLELISKYEARLEKHKEVMKRKMNKKSKKVINKLAA